MKPKPNLDDFLGSAPPAAAATPAAPVDEAALVVMIPIEKLRPNSDQDRGEEHFETAEAREYIESLAASMSLDIGGGKKFGVRDPIKVRPEGDDQLNEIIDGENRWRAAKLAGLAEVPCLIRAGDDVEARIEHVTSNALRSDLNLWQQANSIRKDVEEFGLSTEQVLVAHGLRNKSQLSKIMAVFKLSEDAQAFVRKGYVQDVNLIYDLKKLPDSLLPKLAKRVLDKGESFPAALKAVMPKEPKEPKPPKEPKAGAGQQDGEGGLGGDNPASTAIGVALSVGIEAAIALAVLLDVEVPEGIDSAELAQRLQAKINSLAEGEGK
ncbi:TPA: ParB/RepB/Spo0J family partition protein [Pseudomonas aeruginosa]|uniref:ParB/RepB/Spo0J family partition protein n=1 Tax=Pseudomonas nitroreducens TaxID=46680 RepID=A0ABS0KU03_PSENT|nr:MULTISPECIES: ParB/RepB/Spo0J family partition protein [Pseudomonas]MCS8483123.1 ParB/RepB/Spo0J family partition protein [Pseudomonas aeruginosa]MBG6291567.1 ParB/RepB/Spo0J family partition protein [Pseudomonas nitroreducens]MCT1214669.1 ParB/RepB/Spo0J family partition protein [Pseudomonas aeruginosa]SFA67937.1 ParB/RepB/Spo0J family partition protein [Pseudomonas otitidis]HCF1166526.1 ParB/RepB/Spo0J family partition protein [Pseudomonas aeruginosa]